MAKYYREKDVERIILDLAAESCRLPTIEVSEDCISRADLRRSLARPLENNNADEMYWKGWHDCTVAVETRIADAPSVVPICQKNRQVERAEGEWIWDSDIVCEKCGCEIPHIERVVGDIVLIDSKDWEYCPNCGAKMKGAEDE